jgi:hypothetical protein
LDWKSFLCFYGFYCGDYHHDRRIPGSVELSGLFALGYYRQLAVRGGKIVVRGSVEPLQY